jgi:Methyltransferase domain
MSRDEGVRFVDRYDMLAEEYYDMRRHPTCRNLRDVSFHILRRVLAERPVPALACEIGAGASLLAEFCLEAYGRAEGVILTDASEAMLAYSRRFTPIGARLVVARAEALPFPDRSVALAVSVLGDSYNGPAFWSELARVLQYGAWGIFTVPSYEWAREFRATRQGEYTDWACFELRGGVEIYVPSFILREDEQRALIEEHRLCVREIIHAGIEIAPPQYLLSWQC